jgi:arylsulfatase A-like enzyme
MKTTAYDRWPTAWRGVHAATFMAASFTLAGLTNGAKAEEPKPARKPNIVVIVADDLGNADPGFQGGKEIPTPNLDALAKSGTRFTNGYVSCPVCSPTRAGLVTGRYQQRFGHEFNPGGGGVRQDFGLPLTEKTVADALKPAGYTTGLIGKWHLGSADEFAPQRRGFDEFFGFLGGAHPYLLDQEKANAQPILRGTETTDEKAYLTDAIGREATAFVDKHHEEPFLLFVTFNAVHNPLEAPAKYSDRFKQITDERHRTYAAMLSALDDNVGQVLGKVREHKLEENTLVFFISDNGGPPANTSRNSPLHGQKGTVWEGGIRVPFLLSWKDHVPAGATYDHPVISLDISATAAAVAGAKLADGKPVDGVNLIPFVTGQSKEAPHERLHWRFGQQSALRQGNYKLLKLAGEPARLFDLAADISESNDLAAAKPELVSELSKSFADWNGELEEPRWKPADRNPEQKQRKQKRRAAAGAAQYSSQYETSLLATSNQEARANEPESLVEKRRHHLPNWRLAVQH